MGVSPAEIYSLIASAYVDIFRVKAAVKKNKTPESIAKDFGYAANRSFVLTNASRDARKLSDAKLSVIINELLESDRLVKNDVKISGNSARIALESVITKILRISQGGDL